MVARVIHPRSGAIHRGKILDFPLGATNPAVALLNTTVILINKHLHLCILLCEPRRVLRQAVRLNTRAPALRGPCFTIFGFNGDRQF